MTEENKLSVTMICNARLPSEKAHPWQVVQMWKAFSEIGAQPHLLYPFRFQRRKELSKFGNEFWKYYGLEELAPSMRLPNLDLVHVLDLFPSLINVYARIQQASFAAAATDFMASDARPGTFVWSREILVLPLLSGRCPELPLFYEMHRFPGSQLKRQMSWLSKTTGIICLTKAMKNKLLEQGYPEEKILVEADAWQESLYAKLPAKEEALKKLGLREARKKVVYTGHLYPWKGVDTLIEAMRPLPEIDCFIVGGMLEDRRALIKRHAHWPANVKLIDHLPPQEIPNWLAVADLCVLPNSAKTDLSNLYTSPLKLFETLGAGRALLASDLPSLREVINEEVANFARADDVADWSRAITSCLENEQTEKIEAGRKLAAQHSWKKRAGRIVDFMQHCLKVQNE